MACFYTEGDGKEWLPIGLCEFLRKEIKFPGLPKAPEVI